MHYLMELFDTYLVAIKYWTDLFCQIKVEISTFQLQGNLQCFGTLHVLHDYTEQLV